MQSMVAATCAEIAKTTVSNVAWSPGDAAPERTAERGVDHLEPARRGALFGRREPVDRATDPGRRVRPSSLRGPVEQHGCPQTRQRRRFRGHRKPPASSSRADAMSSASRAA
jgi:hypothetical protein